MEVSLRLMQQRRAVRTTVREERDGAAGDEEPATKSRASTYQQHGKKDQGDGASGTIRRKWSRARSTDSNGENKEPARSPRLLRASARSRGVTSGQRSQSTEWVGRRPRLRLAEGRVVAGRQAGGGGGTCRRNTRTEI